MVSLSYKDQSLKATIPLPSSKSESNRALIIQALSQGKVELDNLSSARDTQTMIRLLSSEGHVLDVIDAGTTMRFLTAYFSAVSRDQILTGTPRMCKRPIGILVEALRELGAEIEYWKQEGFPPLHIISKGSHMEGGEISMKGNVSSQYITALLMIGPTLKGGLRINLEGEISSRPYIEMTRGLMAHFGVESHWENQSIIVKEQAYQKNNYTIESDWSAASYWYAMVAIAEDAEVSLEGLRKDSMQGDRGIVELMKKFGVGSRFNKDGVILTKIKPQAGKGLLEIDFSDMPDMAQTVAVVSAAKGIPVRMTGLHTLRIKETDRIDAIYNELAKFGVEVQVDGNICTIDGTVGKSSSIIKTYDDHRMAMAFAPLLFTQNSLMIDDPEVVQKSYPEFWQHLKLAGVKVDEY
ncbi:MAG: 3-phosphoshikimate 1-carboxyvinyltransferase [Bacteroidia bacterium]|nr:3-phosphoshikimate 1-carboxyvinyltransferase [Bacteroidia bacterium]